MGELYVVRHADAGARGRSDGPDCERALSERGRRQAEALAAALTAVAPLRLVTSPYLRCRQTLEPLGAALGLTVETDERLAEGHDFPGALELAEELRGGPAVMCSHGDVIPDLLDALGRRGMQLRDEPRWPKASIWVLKRNGGGFASARFLPPPV